MGLNIYLYLGDTHQSRVMVYSGQLSHDSGTLAHVVGLYDTIWYPPSPDGIEFHNYVSPLTVRAASLIGRIHEGLDRLQTADPAVLGQSILSRRTELLAFTREYLNALITFPSAFVFVSM